MKVALNQIMTKKRTIRILTSLVFAGIFLVIWIMLQTAFRDLDAGYKGMISAALTVILAPRTKEIKTQSGTKIQLKFLFFTKLISV